MIKLDHPVIQFFRCHNQHTLEIFLKNSFSWDLLIRQARAAHLLGRIAVLLTENNLLPALSEKEQIHLQNALLIAQANERSVRWEIRQIHKVLSGKNIPVIFLKGSAYILLNSSAAKGRVFADVDIMVSNKMIAVSERTLVQNGWMPAKVFDNYYQKYYRKWMHEIPPLRHKKRQTELDVHHTILPPTSTLKPNALLLWDKAQAMTGLPGAFTLSPCDVILHSATHLFHEGEFDNGLRDISDLDLLLNDSAQEEEFWGELVSRAKILDLSRPLFYALRYTSLLLNTPVPENVFRETEAFSPGNFLVKIMDFLFLRALLPRHASCDDHWTSLACWCLYIRSHWLRMPLYLLIPHLLRKSFLQKTGKTQY